MHEAPRTMAPHILHHSRLMMFAVLFLVTLDAAAFGFGKKSSAIQPNPQLEDTKDLATLIRPVPNDQSGIYAQALELLNSMRTSPSCNRLATLTLLDSCRSIDGSQHDAQHSLDSSRSTYAAQLALCEIMSADSVIPPPCKTFLPDVKKGMLRRHNAEDFPKSYLSQCLQALESRPQWWTSYSNSRQNAVVMCQAARADIEKDELLKLHKSSVHTAQDADAALARAVADSNEALARTRNEFEVVRQSFHDQLVRDIKTTSEQTKSYFEKLISSLDSGVQAVLARVVSATRNVESDITSVLENVSAANTKSQELEKNVGQVFQRAVEGSAELASIHTQHLVESSEIATGLQLSLQQMRDMDVHDLVMIIKEMHGQLKITNEFVVSVSTMQNNVATQVSQLSESVTGLQSKAQALQDAQLQQEMAQARLHKDMERGLGSSLSQIIEIEGTAAKLHIAVKEASQSVAQIASLAWIIRRFSIWGCLAVVLSLVIFGFFRIDARFAKVAAATLGLMLLVKASTVLLLDLTYGDVFSSIPLSFHQLVMIGFSLGVFTSIVLLYHHLKVSRRKSQFEEPSNMPLLGLLASEHRLRRTWNI